ncbi:hypothetical protein N202_07400 [Helicobacter pylori UM067]|nr:hypothetical protein N202_07400 [Helicobacter pylori UM067]
MCRLNQEKWVKNPFFKKTPLKMIVFNENRKKAHLVR